MADIKTRDAVMGTIKTIDKAAVASERMKSAYAKTKDKAGQGYYSDENPPNEYAADRVSHAVHRAKDEGVHQFNQQGQKGVQTIKENIVKAKDKMADFKQKRAVQAAEKRQAQNVLENVGSQIRYGAASRTFVSAPSAEMPQNIKTRRQTKLSIKATARNGEKAVKSTAKGTVKAAERGIKTAQTTSKAAIKTTQTSAKAAQKTA